MARPTETELAYIAGLLDGEGCCHIGNAKKNFVPVVQIVNTHEETMRWVHETLGIGNLRCNNVENGVRKELWTWAVYSDAILDFLYMVLPYLHIKLEHAQLMITYLERRTGYAGGHGGSNPVPVEEVKLRSHFRDELVALNKGV